MPITDYSLYNGPGFEGEIVTTETTLIRGTFEEYRNGETVRLPFGRVVRRHADGTIRALTDSATAGFGVTVRVNTYEASATGETGIPPEETVTLLRTGTIWMVAEVAIDHLTDSVFFRFDAQTTPGNHDGIGRVRNDINDDGGAKAIAAPTGARFLASAAAGGLVPVFINFGG